MYYYLHFNVELTVSDMNPYRARALRSGNSMSLGKEVIHGRSSFAPGVLPKERAVIEMMIEMVMPRGQGFHQVSKEEAAVRVAETLTEHWIWCNVYPKHMKNVIKMVENCWEEFRKMVKYPKARQTEKWNLEKAHPYLDKINTTLLDISTNDPGYIKKQEVLYGVKMTQLERDFLQDQIGPQLMFCETFVDKKWVSMDNRRKKDMESHLKTEERSKRDTEMLMSKVQLPDLDDSEDDNKSETYQEPEQEESVKKKRRFENVPEKETSEMPENWKHIRNSERQVRPEYYRVVDLLMSKYHMSHTMATASVVEVGREMFGLDWRFHNEGDDITVNTIPQTSRNRLVGRGIEVFTLAKLCHLILSSDDKTTTITYHDDGSRTQGAGSYSVQGISLNGEFYPLPTLPISRETRENLASLKLTVLELLATCGEVTVQELWARTDFLMTDAVSHNLEVENLVSEKLEMEHTPGHLLCNTHPSLMFSRVMCNVWKDIDITIGSSKIFAGFAVTLTDVQTSVTEQWIDVSLRLVSPDFDHKMWNKASEFNKFIEP